MRGSGYAMLLIGLALAGIAPLQAGVGVAKFSVDAQGKAPAVATKAPEASACALGSAQVKALDGERFEYAGKAYKIDELTKVLAKANKAKVFDCVVIEGAAPADAKARARVIKKLGGGAVKHVQWGATDAQSGKTSRK